MKTQRNKVLYALNHGDGVDILLITGSICIGMLSATLIRFDGAPVKPDVSVLHIASHNIALGLICVALGVLGARLVSALSGFTLGFSAIASMSLVGWTITLQRMFPHVLFEVWAWMWTIALARRFWALPQGNNGSFVHEVKVRFASIGKEVGMLVILYAVAACCEYGEMIYAW